VKSVTWNRGDLPAPVPVAWPECHRSSSIAAGVTLGWERWLGAEGVAIGLDRFGASGPVETLFEQFGFTVANVVRTTKGLLGPR